MIMEKYRYIIKIQKKLDSSRAIVYILTSEPTEPLLSMLNFGGYFFAHKRGDYGI